jgi:hypothetical protein
MVGVPLGPLLRLPFFGQIASVSFSISQLIPAASATRDLAEERQPQQWPQRHADHQQKDWNGRLSSLHCKRD